MHVATARQLAHHGGPGHRIAEHIMDGTGATVDSGSTVADLTSYN